MITSVVSKAENTLRGVDGKGYLATGTRIQNTNW